MDLTERMEPMPSFQADQASNIEAEAQRQKTVLLYRNAGVALWVTIVNAGLLAYVNATLHTAAGLAFVWWVLIVLVAAGRNLLAQRFKAARPEAITAMIWRRRYVGATAAMAAAWGAGIVLFMWQAPVVAQLFTGLVLAGMMAGALPILAPVPAAFRIFALLVCIPMSAAILLQANSPLLWAFGAMTFVFLLAVLASARYLHQTLDVSIRLGLELQQHRAQLEQLVAERTVELALAMKNAEAANNAKSRFLAAASHDLRQPLSALKVYAGLLNNPRVPAYPKMVANTRDCINSLSDLLDDLLDLSKLEAGVVTPTVSDFAIADVFAHLETIHAPEATGKGLRLRCVPSRIVGRTDLVLFRRALGNLLANAISYTERGGVLIACRRRQGKFWVEVWDTGVGIPAENFAEIFEEFKQLGDGSRNSGSGLGLAIVAKTAALLGLGIGLRSRPGRGSVFAIELPLGQAELIVPASAISNAALHTLRIALVEDNPMVRDALVEGLQGLGHRVLAAATTEALLPELEPLPPDIVVSDYRLNAGETGFDVIAAVREQYGAELPAILITGDTDPNLLRGMTGRGIIVLRKPLALETLQTYLQKLTASAR